MDKLKYVKLENPDGTYSESIPLSAEAQYIIMNNGESAEDKLQKTINHYDTLADMLLDTNLKVGDIVMTCGYYSIADGGEAKYLIEDGDGITPDNILTYSVGNDLIAKIIPVNETINILACGGKKENLVFTLNADIINTIIDAGYNCYIPRGNYYITKTISINLRTGGSLFGSSTASRIIRNANVAFIGVSMCEVYDPAGDYYTEPYRGKTAIHDIGFLDSNRSLIGLKIGGDRSSEHEGAVSYTEYRNIHIYRCKTALLIQDHSYKINFYNVWWGDCPSGLRTRQPLKDAGEVINFYGCGLFSGGIYSECAMQFIGCTIHFGRINDIELPEGVSPTIYCINQIVNFTDCHFERIGDGIWDQMIVSKGAIINITGGDFATGSRLSFRDAIFKTINTGNTNGCESIIRVEDTQMRWFLGRCYAAEGYENDFIACKGNVDLKISTKSNTSVESCLPFQIYDSTQTLFMNGMSGNDIMWNEIINNYKKTFAFATEGATFGFNTTNNVLSVHIPNANTSNNFGFYKMYNVHDRKSFNMHIDLTSDSELHFCVNFDDINRANCILFFDKDGNQITSGGNNGGYWLNQEHLKLPQNKDTSGRTSSWFALPSGCEYVLFGIGGYGILNKEYVNITVNELYCEFM